MTQNYEVLKSLLIEANKVNTPELPVYAIFNNCINNAYYNLVNKTPTNPTIINSYCLLINHLTKQVQQYVYNLFTEKSLNKTIKEIEKMEQSNFDQWFQEYIYEKEKTNPQWITPIEKRLQELLSNEK